VMQPVCLHAAYALLTMLVMLLSDKSSEPTAPARMHAPPWLAALKRIATRLSTRRDNAEMERRSRRLLPQAEQSY